MQVWSSPRCLWVIDHYCSCSGIAARLAVQAGAAGIIVSNHGARQLDYVPATIVALEEVPLPLFVFVHLPKKPHTIHYPRIDIPVPTINTKQAYIYESNLSP